MRETKSVGWMIGGATIVWLGLAALAQQPVTTKTEKATRVKTEAAEQPPAPPPAAVPTEVSAEQQIRDVYSKFHNSYKLGPNDEIAVRVQGQPEYSLEKVKISPVGRIFHPLLGDVEVAGRTVPQLTEELTKELSEYVLNPKVSISLLETKSAKIGVLGEVVHPGILVMNEPMKVLDAITAAGGFTDFGSKSNVIVYRQAENGQIGQHEINIKELLTGKATQNLELQPGDTVMVNGNAKKKIAIISSLTGIGSFMTVLGRGR
jgi:polysaccharide export outer membrane protein